MWLGEGYVRSGRASLATLAGDDREVEVVPQTKNRIHGFSLRGGKAITKRF